MSLTMKYTKLHMAQLMPLPLTVSCFSKIQIGFTFLVPAHLGSPGKGPLNGCVYKIHKSIFCTSIWICQLKETKLLYTLLLCVLCKNLRVSVNCNMCVTLTCSVLFYITQTMNVCQAVICMEVYHALVDIFHSIIPWLQCLLRWSKYCMFPLCWSYIPICMFCVTTACVLAVCHPRRLAFLHAFHRCELVI